jgi:hypothetical protein
MRRAAVMSCVGAVVGLLTLAGFGAWFGYAHCDEFVLAPPGLPLQSAARWADTFVHAHWWLAAGIGGIMGGLGGWLSGPRRFDTSDLPSQE